MKIWQVALVSIIVYAVSLVYLSSKTAAPASEFPCDPEKAARYTAYRASDKIKIDGKLDENSWRIVPKSPRFTDIITGKPTMYDTYSAVLWDDENLYVAFWVEDPNVSGNMTERNSPVWQENDVEVFIAGKDTYYEFEINPRNTVYEVFFIWEEVYERDGYSKIPVLSQSNPDVKPFNGVGFPTHPRGPRVGSWAYRLPGLQTAVDIQGTLNDPTDIDKGWTVELAFPWAGMDLLVKADGRPLPPKDADVWRMDFSRFNSYKTPPPAEDSSGWFWTPHGVWDSHIPECFAHISFSKKEIADTIVA